MITLQTLCTMPAYTAMAEVVSTLHRKYKILRVTLMYSYSLLSLRTLFTNWLMKFLVMNF